MSDYMFMVESHLSADQFRVVGQLRELAGSAGVNLYLSGGAIRDMLAGFPVRDLDFTVEGNAAKLAKICEAKLGAKLVETDELRKRVELLFAANVTVSIGTAHVEKFAKSGGKPQVSVATIYEDLRMRDFTCNAVALSLNKASLGLPIDPTNGVGDIERKELRAIHNYSFYDDPARLLRLVRFRVRLGFAVDERTRLQVENARGAEMLDKVTSEALGEELRHIAAEPLSHDIVKALEEEKLIGLFSPALEGAKLNLADLSKLQKSRQLAPFGSGLKLAAMPLFLTVLLDKLNAKERAAFFKSVEVSRGDQNAWQKLPAVAKKLEKELKSPKLQKASQLYTAVSKAPGEAVLYLVIYSGQRLVTDRIKNYFAKYLPMAMEVTDEVAATTTGIAAGTPKFAKAKEELVAKTLDARPKKVAPPPEPPPPPPPTSGFGRGPSVRQARPPA